MTVTVTRRTNPSSPFNPATFPERWAEAARPASREVADLIKADAIEVTRGEMRPDGKTVGNYIGSFKADGDAIGLRCAGSVVNEAPHAKYVHEGRPAGKGSPPDAIRAYLEAHGDLAGLSEAEQDQFVRNVSRKHKYNPIPGKPIRQKVRARWSRRRVGDELKARIGRRLWRGRV